MPKIFFITKKEDELLSLVFSQLSDEFQKLGISSSLLYYENMTTFSSVLPILMNDKELLFFVGINGFGANFIMDDPAGGTVLLWEKIRKPFFNLQADPCFTLEMNGNSSDSYNPFRVDFLTDIMNMYWLIKKRKSTANIYSFPSFAAYVKTDEENKYKSILDRPIKSLLCVSLSEPSYFYSRFKLSLKTDSKLYLKIFDNIVDVFESDLRSDPVIWSDVAFQREGVTFDLTNKTHQHLLSEAWHYIRMKRRFSLLSSLSTFPLHLIASGQKLPKTIKLHKETSINAPVSFNQYINILGHAQVHICPPTQYYGFHERQALSMYQHCVTISPPNVAFEEKLSHGDNILFYHDLTKDLPSVMRNILTKDEDIKRISSNSRESAARLFSAKISAQHFLNVYKSLKKNWR